MLCTGGVDRACEPWRTLRRACPRRRFAAGCRGGDSNPTAARVKRLYCRNRSRIVSRSSSGRPRASSRSTSCGSDTSSASTRSSGMLRSASMRSSASAWGTVRGKPSNKQPRAQSLSASRSHDDADDDVIGHELAGVHVAGRLAAERGAGLVGVAQHLAGREMGDAEIVLQPLGLRPLSRAGRTKEHDAHERDGRSRSECQVSGRRRIRESAAVIVTDRPESLQIPF